jgi:anti-anti-sigma factor
MPIQVERVGDVAVVTAGKRLIIEAEIEDLDATLTKLIVDEGQAKTILNMSETRLVNSMALGVLVKTQLAIRERQAHFALCDVHPRLKALISRCFGSVIREYETCDEALKAMENV